MKRAIAICLLVASGAMAQVTFDASALCAAMPAPCGTAGDPEALSGNGALFGTNLATADTANGAGFPTNGTQYGRVRADGAGPALAAELYIPVPLGAATVSFSWDFYDAEGGQSGFNDGMSIDVLGACGGVVLANLVAIDDNTFVFGGFFDTGSACGSGAGDHAPGGPNTVTNAALPGGSALIRVACWNGTDNIADSAAVIDCVNFNSGPCTVPPPPCSLFFSSPAGPGSLQIDNTQCAASAGLDYQIAIAFAPGLFPNGWWFGVDIPFIQLIGQHDPVFQNILWGTLDGAGASSFGPVGGIPSGLQIWANTVEFSAGFNIPQFVRTPVTYTIP